MLGSVAAIRTDLRLNAYLWEVDDKGLRLCGYCIAGRIEQDRKD